ncbi:MAG: VOC family protein [Candidatus Binatia bacterium]
MVTTLDHIVIGVRDLAASTATLTRLLGRRPSWRGAHAAYGTANTLYRLDKTYIELLAPERTGQIADQLRDWLDQNGEGLFALAFGTDDIDRALAALGAKGVAVSEAAEGRGRELTSGVEREWRSSFLPLTETRGAMLFLIQHLSPASRLPPAEPIAEAAAAISGCDHVVVQTPDPDAAIQLYREKLGLRLALDRTFRDWGARLVFFRVGGITVELVAELGVRDRSGPDRLWGISYQAPDVAAARARLAGQGFDVSEVRPGRKPATRVFTVRGEPCGVATLVIGAETPPA